MLFLYDPLYASSHDLESDYPWSGLKNKNSPIPEPWPLNPWTLFSNYYKVLLFSFLK